MSEKPKFLEGSLFRHVAVMSLTASFGLMAVFAVDLVDMIFISMLGKAELAAAVGYAGAILFFTTSFGIGMAIAAGAVVARALGQGDEALARKRSASALLWGFATGALFALVVWLNLRPITRLVGAEGEALELAIGYLSIIVPSLPILLVGMVGGAILRAHGDARRSMMATLVGATVNAVLDPILIFGFGLDLTGAALASVAARIAIGAMSLVPILRHHGGFETPTRAGLMQDAGPIFSIAIPAVLTQLATPVGQAFVTRAMSSYGEEAVAGMAIVGRLTPIAFGIVFALSGAVGPIIGQNAGAGLQDRVAGTFRDALLFSAGVIVIAAGLLFGLRAPLEVLFDLNGVSRELVFLFAGPLALLFFFNAVIFVANAAFNNLGHPYYSTWINWGRHTLGTIPFVMLGSAWLDAPGVLIGQYLGGVVFGIIAWILARRVIAIGQVEDGRSSFERQARHFRLLNPRR